MAPTDPVKSRAPEFDAEEYLERTLTRNPGDLRKVFLMQGRHWFRVNWYSSRASQEATIADQGAS